MSPTKPTYPSRAAAERQKTEAMETLKAEAEKLRKKDTSLTESAALLMAMRANPVAATAAKNADRVLKQQ